MKKLILTVMGLAAAGVLSFGASTLSESKQAGHRDYPVSKDDVKQYAAHGDTPAPQRPNLAYNIGDTPAPANNKGDGGIISNKSVSDPGTGSPSYAAHGDPGGGMVSNESIEDPGVGGGIISNEADGNTGIIAQA